LGETGVKMGDRRLKPILIAGGVIVAVVLVIILIVHHTNSRYFLKIS
jgi:hypothetical protein